MKKMILWTIVLLGPLTWTTTASAIFGIPDVAALAQRVTISPIKASRSAMP